MALELDGFETWRAIADHPLLFAPLRPEASKGARTALSKLFKSRAIAVPELRQIMSALGRDIVALVINGMKDREVKTMVGRLDKHHPEQKAASAEWRRRHLLTLARGDVEPVAKPAPAGRSRSGGRPKSRRKRVAETPGGLSYVSAGATRKR